jgi:heme/copper-type cytochrome/quinol oxidase subunit 2
LAGIFSTKVKSTKSTETKESFKMNKDIITIAVSVIIVLCTAIIGVIVYNVNDRNNMAKNIEAAIAKGVDPISVKCAYETNVNSVCIAYSMAKK